MQPVKILLGGIVFAAVMAPEGWISMTVCGILGLVIAGLADGARGSFRPQATTDAGPLIFISIYEDLIVLIGTLLFVLVPLVGALLALFLFLLIYRLRLRRTRKHKGLRILKG
jgi:phosphate/sulfate permease